MRKLLLISVVMPLAFSVLIAGAEKTVPAKGTSKKVREFLGEQVLKVLAEANRVEVFRLDAIEHRNPGTDEKAPVERVAGYKVTAAGAVQGPGFASDVRAVLFDENTYDFDSAKGCEFTPGVALRIHGADASIDVLLCFSCNELAIFDSSQKDVKPLFEDFDASRPALVDLAKRAFPEDKEIQDLHEAVE